MVLEVRADKKNTVILDTDVVYSGKEKVEGEEKLVRKALGLPVTKQLVYYGNPTNADSVVKVREYRLSEMYDVTENWYTVDVLLEDGSRELIHSLYLAEMQKPSFIEDMAAQAGHAG